MDYPRCNPVLLTQWLQKSLYSIALGVILTLEVIGVDCSPNPPYEVSGRLCLVSVECRQTYGEVCWWFYDGCEKGVCACDPRKYTPAPDGDCIPIKLGGDACTTDVVCPRGMSCQQGRCTCRLGKVTPDKRFCRQAYHRLLGEHCVPFDNTCVQIGASGYTDADTACDYQTQNCRCVEGYKQDGYSCRRRNIGEGGCQLDYHCHGGAICREGKCACPRGYFSVADSTKCAPIAAKTNVVIGQTCDESSESKYCSFGLVCHQCAGETQYKCLRYEAIPENSIVNMQVSGAGLMLQWAGVKLVLYFTAWLFMYIFFTDIDIYSL